MFLKKNADFLGMVNHNKEEIVKPYVCPFCVHDTRSEISKQKLSCSMSFWVNDVQCDTIIKFQSPTSIFCVHDILAEFMVHKIL